MDRVAAPNRTLAVTSVHSLLCQASTCLRIVSNLRCIRSTATEMHEEAGTTLSVLRERE